MVVANCTFVVLVVITCVEVDVVKKVVVEVAVTLRGGVSRSYFREQVDYKRM